MAGIALKNHAYLPGFFCLQNFKRRCSHQGHVRVGLTVGALDAAGNGFPVKSVAGLEYERHRLGLSCSGLWLPDSVKF